MTASGRKRRHKLNFISAGYPVLFGVLCILHHIVPAFLRPALLLSFSMLLYAGEGLYALGFLWGVIFVCYAGGLVMGNMEAKGREAALGAETKEEKKALKAALKKKKGAVLAVVLFVNLAVLFLCKFPVLPCGSLLMPLGLSFFMFQALGYCIDVRMGKIPPERNLLKFALFVSFFPQLIQGPIGRYKDLTPALFAGRKPSEEDTRVGAVRILSGYIKKLVLADRLTASVSLLLSNRTDGAAVFFGAILYAFRLLWDFTGGIDIAIGSARMLGVVMAENFRAPYLSRNLEEYWTRWHISMGSWFRDYVFYPLNMKPFMLRLGVKLKDRFGNFFGRVPLYVSLLVTWLLTGVWHGSSWNFILWGLTNGLILLAATETAPLKEGFHARHPGLKQNGAYAAFVTVRTFLLLCLIRLWDLYAEPSGVLSAVARLFTAFHFSSVPGILSVLPLGIGDAVILLSGFAATLAYDISEYRGKPLRVLEESRVLFFAALFFGILFLLAFGKYGIGYDAASFIYGKF